jgi:hypothetical protein
VTPPPPERVLRLSLIGWGLGEMAMGRSRIGLAWLVAEALLLASVAATTLLWADTTWYLVPFLLGVAFLVTWTGQAVLAFRRARSMQAASPAAPPRSPAAIVAWLTVPLLAWGTGFWLVGGHAATPAAPVDEFVSRWSELHPVPPPPLDRHDESPMIEQEAAEALYALQQLCELAILTPDCRAATKNLLRDVRVSIEPVGELQATATAHLVEYRRRETKVLGFLQGSEIQPVPIRTVLTLSLESQPAAWGARRWVIVNAAAR